MKILCALCAALLLLSVYLVFGWRSDSQADSKELQKYSQLTQSLYDQLGAQQQKQMAELKTESDMRESLSQYRATAQEIDKERDESDTDIQQANKDKITLSNSLLALKADYDKLKSRFDTACTNCRHNYEEAASWNEEALKWHGEFLKLVDYTRSQNVSVATTSFNPDAISNPEARQQLQPQAPPSPGAPGMTGAQEDGYFLPPTTTAMDPQTGETVIVH